MRAHRLLIPLGDADNLRAPHDTALLWPDEFQFLDESLKAPKPSIQAPHYWYQVWSDH